MEIPQREIERLHETGEAVEVALARVLDAITSGKEALQRRLDLLNDLNSRFPETREFLMARGLEHVSELDEAGIRELEEHLKRVLEDLKLK